MAGISLALSALLATASALRVLHQTQENTASSDGSSFQHGPFFTPREIALRTQLAQQAAVAANLSTRLSDALQQAAASSEVNDIDAATAINSTLQSLLPWDGFAAVQAADGSVVSWPAGSPAGGVTIRPPETAIAQPLPASKLNISCCAQLAAIGFATNLPVVVIDTKGVVVPLREDVAATVCTCGASSDLDALATIKIRGSSSAVQMVKKSFGISIRSAKDGTAPSALDATLLKQQVGRKLDVPLLDMPAASDWALYGDNLDQTLGMRNALAFDIARSMDGYWAPRTQFFELFLIQDGGQLNISHYWGPYLAMEKIEIHRNRLALHKLDLDKQPADLSGGYVLGYERSLWPSDVRVKPSYWSAAVAGHAQDGDAVLSTCRSGDGRNLTYLLHEPTAKGTNAEQQSRGPPSNETQMVAWIASYLGSVEAAVVLDQLPGANNNSSQGTGGWRALVNEKAFIEYLLSQEIVKNPDFARGSLYMYKDRGGLLVMGPPWDLNEAFGMCCGYPIEGFQNQGISNGSSGGSAISPEGWRFNICDEPQRCIEDPVDGISIWWRSVWAREPWFKAAVAARWKELRSRPLSDDFFKQRFTFYMSQLQFAAPRNYERWKSVLASPFFATGQELYSSSVDQMIQWTMQRLAWIDQALSQLLPSSTASVPEPTPDETAAVQAGVVGCADRAAAYAASRVTQHSAASQADHLPAAENLDSLEAIRQRLVIAQSQTQSLSVVP